MDNRSKFSVAVQKLKSTAEFITRQDINSEDDFKTVEWVTGADSEGASIVTKTCPHSEVTWIKVKAEMDKL